MPTTIFDDEYVAILWDVTEEELRAALDSDEVRATLLSDRPDAWLECLTVKYRELEQQFAERNEEHAENLAKAKDNSGVQNLKKAHSQWKRGANHFKNIIYRHLKQAQRNEMLRAEASEANRARTALDAVEVLLTEETPVELSAEHIEDALSVIRGYYADDVT